MKKKLLSLLLAGAMTIQMVSGVALPVQAKDKAVAQTTEVKAATDLQLSIRRAADNVVTMKWNAVDGAVSYNVYDVPHAGTSTKLGNTKDTTFVADKLEVGKVHTLTVKAVDASGTEISTSNAKKVGITEKIDVTTEGVKTLEDNKAKLKLPVSDLAGNMDYVGPTIQDDQYHYWCYSSIKDEEGKVHLFMSRVPRDTKFIPGWKTTSEIVHFVGDSQEGPFTEVGVPFAPGTLPDGQQSAHNPRIKKVGDKYVLLYIVRYNYQGAGREGYQTTCMATIDKLPTEPGSDTIDKWTLATDTGLDLANPGKVDESKKGLQNGVIIRYGLKSVNPDMFKVTDENGKDEYVMYFKGNKNPNVEAGPYFLYTATAENLMGPYTLKGEATDSKTTIEDPSVFEWKGKYFMLTYDLGNGISGAGKEVGMLIPSRDPYHFSFKDAWITAGLLPDYLTMPAGYTHAYSGSTRMERPYIVFEDDAPKYFIGTNSGGVDGNNVTQSYTFKFNELPTHKLAVDETVEGGKIEVVDNVTEAQIFDDIIFKVTADEGCELVSVEVNSNDAMGRPYTSNVETLEDGTYRFMMPSGDTTITAKFKDLTKDATLQNIKLGEVSMPGFKADQFDYTWEVAKDASLPVVSGVAASEKAVVEVTQADAESRKAVITVTAEDGVTKMTYTVTFVEAVEIENAWGTSFEEEDPMSLWETLDSRGTYTEVTEEQAHEGTHSFVTRGRGDKKSWIFKKFDQPVTGKVSVWFYDTMGKMGRENFQQVNIWGPFEDVSQQPLITGIGTEGGKPVYSVRANGYLPTTVQRTEGWHEFVFDVTSGTGATFYIDGQEVYVNKDLTAIGALQMGDIWSTSGATAYYDDIKITDIQKLASGVMLNKESQNMKYGETLQLEASVLPVGTTSDIIWTSDNEEVATVDENGLVTAGNVDGTAKITATTVKGGYKAVCEVNVHEHKWDTEYTVDVEATCTEEGSKSIHCATCEEVKDVQTIPALGHAFGDWKVVKEATATEDGCKERTCTRCDYTETEVIPATGETTPPDTDGGSDNSKPEQKPEEKPNDGAVPTGDSTNVMLWGTVLILGFAGITVFAKRRKED